MEHKIILGGEIYLPFARSRIKALRATGLEYASQSFEVEGVSIKVSIEPGHEYIRLDGGGCKIPMDSGLVDAVNLGTMNPARYLPGVFYDTNYSLEYNTSFTKISAKNYKTNPSKINQGQFSGTLTAFPTGKGKFRGSIPPIAYSFYPRIEEVTPATDPPTKAPTKEDEDLLIKKVCAVFCPASVFTGKCRLYVQAMYGQPLHDKFGLGSESLGPVTVDPGVPALLIRGYAVPGKEAGQVFLNTSCGVKLDINGNHWLFRIALEGVTTYPLIASPCGEKLRKFLKPTNTVLDTTDKEHLEAYILSTCRPYVDKAKFFDLSGFLADSGLYSLGFGWHWNWDGTNADLVKNETWSQGGVNAAMESWHYTIVASQTIDDDGISTFKFVGDNPKGKLRWAVTRALVVIAEPLNLSQTLIKTTPQYSELFAHEPAPFYAFYKKNELILCTVETIFTPSHAEYKSSHNGDTLAGWNTRGYSQGERDEWWEARTYVPYYTFVIDIPGLERSEVHRGKSYTNDRFEVGSKTRTGPPISAEGGIGGATIDTPLGTISGQMDAGMHYPLSWKVKNADGPGVIVGNAAVVVPMHDAEAVHRSFGSLDTSTLTVNEELQNGYMPWDYGYRVWAYSDAAKTGPFVDYIWWTTGGFASFRTGGFPLSTYARTDSKSIGDETLLYSRDSTPVAFGDSIHAIMDTNQEESPDPFRTITSAAGKTVYVTAHRDPPFNILHPIFVGWV